MEEKLFFFFLWCCSNVKHISLSGLQTVRHQRHHKTHDLCGMLIAAMQKCKSNEFSSARLHYSTLLSKWFHCILHWIWHTAWPWHDSPFNLLYRSHSFTINGLVSSFRLPALCVYERSCRKEGFCFSELISSLRMINCRLLRPCIQNHITCYYFC